MCGRFGFFESVHDRMPVILEPEHWKVWLDAGTPDAVKLLVPAGEDKLDIYPVSVKVNNPRYNSRDVIEQITDIVTFPDDLP
jgi:putative SOS response-associated peptidase YedK